MVLFLVFAVALGVVLWRWPALLWDGVGVVVAYLAGWGGLCLLFRHVPSPLWVRAGVLIAATIAVWFLARKVSLRNSTVKAVVLYFACLTTLSGLAQWVTEGDRMVEAKRPVIRETTISLVQDDGTLKEVRREEHTFVEPYSCNGEALIDCWFNAVSAACVTGLTSTDFSRFTTAGHVITAVTIVAGGLGIILFAILVGVVVTRESSTRKELDTVAAEAIDVEPKFVARMVKQVLLITALSIGTGTLILGLYFTYWADPTPLKGVNVWWWALFHALSAFFNAGFSLNNDNLCGFVTDPVVNLVICSEVIIGGLGYAVIIRIWLWVRVSLLGHNGRTASLVRHLEVVQASRLQTLICLQGTLLLLKLGTVVPFALDWDNPVFAEYTTFQRLMICFYHSVYARTAGFNNIDLGTLCVGSLLVYIALMYIGACPQGTAGGVKLTTMSVLVAYVCNWFREPFKPVVIRKPILFHWLAVLQYWWKERRGKLTPEDVDPNLERDWLVNKHTMPAAIRLFVSSLIVLGVGTWLICLFEGRYMRTPDPTFNYLKALFEAVSAWGTVGSSMGYDGAVTSWAGILCDDSKIVLILLMLIGRLSPLTILAIFPWRKDYGVIDLLVPERTKPIQIG